MSRLPDRTQAWLTLGALALVWGSSYILIKWSLASLQAWHVGCLRVTLAGLAFAPIAGRYCRGLTAKQWGTLTVIGFFGTGLPSLLFPLAQRDLSSSMAAALSALTPLMTTALAGSVFGLVISGRRRLGIFVGLTGALLLVIARYGLPGAGGADAPTSWPLVGVALAVGATLSYAVSSNMVKRFVGGLPALTVTAGALVPMAILGLAGLVFGGDLPGLRTEGNTDIDATILRSYFAVSFLALIGTALASWLFFRLIQLTDPVFASTVSYLVPGVALVWGLADGEVITVPMVGALLLVLAGVYLTKR